MPTYLMSAPPPLPTSVSTEPGGCSIRFGQSEIDAWIADLQRQAKGPRRVAGLCLIDVNLWIYWFKKGDTYISGYRCKKSDLASQLVTAEGDTSRQFQIDDVVVAQVDEFLEEVYRLASAGEDRSTTNRVFDHIENLLYHGSFRACDLVLERSRFEPAQYGSDAVLFDDYFRRQGQVAGERTAVLAHSD